MKNIKHLLLFVLLAFPALFYVLWSSVSLEQVAYGAINFTASISGTENDVEDDRPVLPIAFVGDVLLARDVEESMILYGSEYPFSIFYQLPLYGAVVANFESSIPKTHHKTPSLTTRFSTDAKYVKELFSHGITHVSLANNHSNDYGAVGYKNTLSVFQSQYIVPFGNSLDVSTSSVTFIELATTTVSVVAIHTLFSDIDSVALEQVIEYAKLRSDYVIGYVHWGDEYVTTHNRAQQQLAFMLIDFGADAVIGHHPHVVQDIERYAGKPIIYSLGNFIFDQYFSKEVQEGLLLELHFTEDEAVYTLKPVTSVASRNKPRLMMGYERQEFLDSLSLKSSAVLRPGIENGELRFQR